MALIPHLNERQVRLAAAVEARSLGSLADFPDETSVKYLQDVGVTHVLVDGRNMRRRQLDRLPQFQALKLWVTDGNLRIYQLAR